MSQPRGMCKPNKYKNESINRIISTQIKFATKLKLITNPQTTQTKKKTKHCVNQHENFISFQSQNE